MNHQLQVKRMLLLLFLLGATFAGLGYRLVDLQVLRHDELSVKAEQNTQHEFRQAPQRGDILDVNGNILATSIAVKRICADPSLIGSQALVVAHAIAPLLQLNENDLAQKLTLRSYLARNNQNVTVTNQLKYIRLAERISEETWQKIQTTMTNLVFAVDEKKLAKTNQVFLANLRQHAVFAEPDQMRIYPNGSLAAQVIGFSGIEETNVDGHAISQIVGRDGIEFTLNKQLDGAAGWRLTETDSTHRELVAWREEDVSARAGLNAVLTIDEVVQQVLETNLMVAMQKHSPKSITGIIMRPRTGEILALASLPSYDPNQPNTAKSGTQDRVIADVMEPGSTFKIVVVSGALNGGMVKLTDEFDCEHGHFAFAGRVLHDHEAYGMLSVKQIITKSSNIGAAKIAIERLHEQPLYDYAWNYGFGQRTGILLPGEARGLLYPVKDWSKVSIAQIPMGHGVAVTRLQMIMAMAAIANHGWLMRPTIVSQLQTHDGRVVQRYAPERIRQVIGEKADADMIETLKTVPTKDGTAPDAAMKNYVAAGKTGTAQKAEGGVYVSGKYVSSFIGFFPADYPELCISIVMDEPKEGYYGGKVCGPVFRDIAERCASYLNIPPDPNMTTNAPPLAVGNSAQKL